MKISSENIANLPVLLAKSDSEDTELIVPPLVVKALALPFTTYQAISFTAAANETSIASAGQVGQQVGAGSTSINLIAGCKGVWDFLISGVCTVSAGGSIQTLVIFRIKSLDGTRNIMDLAIMAPFSDSAKANGYINVQRTVALAEPWRLAADHSSTVGITLDSMTTAQANRLL